MNTPREEPQFLPLFTSRRRRDAAGAVEPEAIREGRLVENDRGDTMRYWTISGRSLVASNVVNSTYAKDYGSSDQLLMDVERIIGENEEARSMRGEDGKREEMGGENIKGEAIKGEDAAVDQDFDTNQYYNDQQTDGNERGEGTTSTLYQPIRLRAIFTDDHTSGSQYLTPSQRTILMEKIINPALFAWSRALYVVPVGGGGGSGSQDRLVVDRHQLFDGQTCGPGMDSGLPSVRVPREHMDQGLENTDAVVYVSVSFADGSEVGSASDPDPEAPFPILHHLHRGASGPMYSGRSKRKRDTNQTLIMYAENETSAFPSSFPSRLPSLNPTETEPFVETRPTCSATYLASATFCSTDQYDRPVAGILSLCISNIHEFFYDTDKIKRNIVTVMHEIGHILGFNTLSLASFRDPDTGEPLTPRDTHGDVPEKKVECTGVFPRTRSVVPLPSESIMKFRRVRGGVRVATIVTPTVRRVARNMFGCRTLEGAELESGEGQMFMEAGEDAGYPSPGDCLGDHWARRSFREDLMNAIVDDVPFSLHVSSLTLAYFLDSGWYKVDAERIAPPAIWGRNAGCAFIDKKCITSKGHVTASGNPFFCNNFLEHEPEEEVAEIHGCDLYSSRKAVCSLVEYESPIPEEYNYFEHEKYLDHTHYYGGSDPTLEYCPVFEGFANGRCDDEESKELMEVRGSLETFGEDNSRCLIGNIGRRRTALCLPIACVIQERSLMVKVDGYWKPCSYAGQIISVWWNPNDYVVCPDPTRICPTFFCPGDCLREGGICDSGQCMCAIAFNASASNSTSWFSNYYTYQRFEPCSGGREHFEVSSSQIVERIDVELPEYYVENTTVLLDDPRDFDDKVSRMFSQLSSMEVVGLVASFMMCIIFSFIVWSQLVRCYKTRFFGMSPSKALSGFGSFSRLLCGENGSTLDNMTEGGGDTLRHRNRSREGRNPQKDKMVATLLVQMRMEHHQRLQLGGLVPTALNDPEGKVTSVGTSDVPTIVDLASASDKEVIVHRSDLPPLREGRVLAVVGAHIVEDQNEDAGSINTSATQSSGSAKSSLHRDNEMSEFTSPLYMDCSDVRMRGSNGKLRLRRNAD